MKIIRKFRGLTQKDISENETYSSTAVSNWEHRDALPKGEVLDRLAEKLTVSTLFLTQGIPWVPSDFEIIEGLNIEIPKERDPSEAAQARPRAAGTKYRLPEAHDMTVEEERTQVLDMVDELFDRLQELKEKEGETGRASRIEDILLIFKPFIKMEEGNADIPPYIRTVLKTHVPPDILEKLNL